MNKLLLAAALASATFATHADNAPARRTIQLRQIDVPARKIQLSSPDFKNGGRFAAAQTAGEPCCEGANISPALNWSGVPKEAKSMVLTMYDPDAPAGSGVWHWLVYSESK